jgi:GMP synthase-like glutamine amidotransferase
MRIHYLQHIEFEGPAAIEQWAVAAGYVINSSHLYRGDPLPQPECFDLLVLMGGPTSVNDERDHPWLSMEKKLVRASIESRARNSGHLPRRADNSQCARAACTGPPRRRSAGFRFIARLQTGSARCSPRSLDRFIGGETFDLPAGAVHLAETPVVPNQAFQVGPRVIGLQFHLEVTPESVKELVENSAHEIQAGKRYQQAPESIVTESLQAFKLCAPGFAHGPSASGELNKGTLSTL